MVKVEKLLKVGFIEEVPHTTWLANMFMVKKANGSWKMCMNFTNIGKAYPNNSYPLPNINSLVNATSRYTILRFGDAL